VTSADLIAALASASATVSAAEHLHGVADVTVQHGADAVQVLRDAAAVALATLTVRLAADAASSASARTTAATSRALAARLADHALADAAAWCRRAHAALTLAPDEADAAAVALASATRATAEVVQRAGYRVSAALRATGERPTATATSRGRSPWGAHPRADAPLYEYPTAVGGVAIAAYVLAALRAAWVALATVADALEAA
jgi:hypothetical protein